MFDIGFSEIVLIAIVALLVTDPKDLPGIMFKAGRFFRGFKMIASRVTNTIGDVMHELESEHYRRDYKNHPAVLEADREADKALEQKVLDAVAKEDAAAVTEEANRAD